jgi:hypothetical protein
MYLGNMSGYGTKDFNKALKGTNIAAIQKGIDVQRAQLAKSKKPKDIARNQAQLAAAEQRMAEVLAAQSTPAITPAPPPVSAPASTVSPLPAVAPPPPSIAPLPASQTPTPPMALSPWMPTPSSFTTLPAPNESPGTPAPVAEPENKMPLYLGLGALGLLGVFFMSKKKR